MVQSKCGVRRVEVRKGAERHLCAVGGFHVNVFQRVGILLKLRVYFDDHVILIQLSEDGGDLPLAISVVERVINIRGENAEARGGVTVNAERSEQTLIQLVAGDVAQLRKRFQLVHESRGPIGKLFRVHVFKAVLELRAADAVFDGQVLNWLEKKRDAVHLGKFRLEAANYVRSVDFALGQRLQIDLHAAGVESGVCAVNTNERGEAFDGRVFQDHVSESALAPGHGIKRNALRAFGNAEDNAGVLHGKESLRYVDIEKDRANKRANGDKERGSAVTQHELQRAPIKGDDRVEGVFRLAVKPALLFFFLMAKKLGAHHGRER